jgi:hypothetical protein
MTIWILAILLLAGLAAAGYSQGAIKVGFSLLGILVGIPLALPLAPVVIMVLPLFGVTNPWTQYIIAPIVSLMLVGVVFKVAAAFVHRKVDYHYKYRASDAVRALWERMNRRTGLVLGMVNGWVYFLLICLLASVLGYFTTQVNPGETSSFALKSFNKLSEDLKSTGMDKAVAGLTPVQFLNEKRYYEISDFLGFLANNRSVFQRFKTYPPFVVMAKKPAFQGLANDNDFARTVQTEQDFAAIVNQPRIQEMLTNSEAMNEIMAVDLNDLTAYLTTGESPKHKQERILGSWVYNFPSSFNLTRRHNRDLLTSQVMKLRKELDGREGRFANAVLNATLDNKVTVQIPTPAEGTSIAGLSNAPPRSSFTGTWKHNGDTYQLSLTPSFKNVYRPPGTPAPPSSTATAVIEKTPEVEHISIKLGGNTVVFDKIPE